MTFASGESCVSTLALYITILSMGGVISLRIFDASPTFLAALGLALFFMAIICQNYALSGVLSPLWWLVIGQPLYVLSLMIYVLLSRAFAARIVARVGLCPWDRHAVPRRKAAV